MTAEQFAAQQLADDKMRAEIAKMAAEVVKMAAETRQVTVMTFLAPFAAAVGLIGAVATIVKVFFP